MLVSDFGEDDHHAVDTDRRWAVGACAAAIPGPAECADLAFDRISSEPVNLEAAPTLAFNDTFQASITSIVDFDGEDDTIIFRATGINQPAPTLPGNPIELDTGQIEAVAASSTLLGALQYVALQVGASHWTTFRYDGSTYVYNNDATTAFSTGDGLVELTDFLGPLTPSNFETTIQLG
jgi:hypothetical protein